MNVGELNQRIAVLNAESKRLNNERQLNIGKRDALSKQLTDAIHLYKETYGVTLTPETLGQEIERVAKMKETEVATIEKMLALISEGKYVEAEALTNGNTEAVPVEAQKVVEPQTNETAVPSFTAPQTQETVASPVQKPVAPAVQPILSGLDLGTQTEAVPTPPIMPNVPNFGTPIPQVAPQVQEPVAPPMGMPIQPVAPSAPVTPPSMTIPTPPVAPSAPHVEQPTPSKNITSFGAILGGGSGFFQP